MNYIKEEFYRMQSTTGNAVSKWQDEANDLRTGLSKLNEKIQDQEKDMERLQKMFEQTRIKTPLMPMGRPQPDDSLLQRTHLADMMYHIRRYL